MTEGDKHITRLEVVDTAAWEAERLRVQGTEYTRAHAPLIVNACLRQGLNPELIPYFEPHLMDLFVAIRNDSFHRTLSGLTTKPNEFALSSSELRVMPLMLGGEKVPTWRRLFIVSKQETEDKLASLKDAFTDKGVVALDDAKLKVSVLDWIFAEQSMAALGTACYEQRNHGYYIPDFHGQSAYYRAEHTLSIDYLQRHPELEVSAEEDYENLKRGFGVMMLHESLLSKKVVSKAKLADWVIEHVRQQFPLAYRSEQIRARLE